PHHEPPVDINPKPCARGIVDGLKVEALAAPSPAITGSVLSIATDDEPYGGLWRPLYDSPVDCDGKLGAAVLPAGGGALGLWMSDAAITAQIQAINQNNIRGKGRPGC
ncbi:MAG: hypothetical protein WA970_07355, partial [Gammaproteobacteria bacterium]